MNFRVLSFLFVIGLSLFSCKQEEASISDPTVEYFLDDQLITEPQFLEIHNNTLNIVEVKNECIVVNAYTSREKYIDWGDINGHDLKSGLEASEFLSNYAADNGYIEEYEKTGIISEEYQNFSDNYLVDNGLVPEVQNRVVTHLMQTCLFNPNIPVLNLHPVMPSGWNNSVSRMWTYSPFAICRIYNRTFFRSHITTMIISGFDDYCFQSPALQFLDNRLSSIIIL